MVSWIFSGVKSFHSLQISRLTMMQQSSNVAAYPPLLMGNQPGRTLMPRILCGNCLHLHGKQCRVAGCDCSHPTRRPRPSPNHQTINDYMSSHQMTFRSIALVAVGAGFEVDSAQVWRILRGRSNPTYDTLIGISRGMGVTMEWLVETLGIEWKKQEAAQ